MKPTNFINSLLILIISICLFGDLKAQMMIIPDVPDLQQPIDPWWGNLPDNACAPVSAANICVYWDDSIHHSNAMGLNSKLIADSVPSFLYYFMGTNGMGDPTRANPSVFGITPGTITMDIDTGFQEYVRWDTSNMFFTPKPFSIPASKTGFDWKIEKDEILGFHFHMMEIDARRPDIVVFKYWNPDTTGIVMASEMGGDSIHFFLWDTAVSSADFPHPHEDWYFDEKTNSAGHAVTGVGYLFGWDPDEGGPLPIMDWIICHDNWATTPVNIAIPWVDSLWITTFTADPGPDTILPYISCMDTTVYLDGSGQYHIDESYIVDSAWDNNGVDQLFLDDYYVLCPYTETPKTVTATAMDMFGNMAQCTALVTVVDTIRPIPLCTDTTVYLDATGNVTIDSSYVDNGSSDNCNVSTIDISQSSFICMDVGPNLVDVTVTDVNSNSSQCQALVTVTDTIRPIPLCRDTTVYLDATGNVTIDSTYVDNGSSDNCNVSTIDISQSSFNCMDVGPNLVDVTVTDVNSNSSQCQALVTVIDTIRPIPICTDTTVYLDATGNVTIDSSYVNDGSTDNCGISAAVLSRNVFNTDDLESLQPVSLTVYDESGNSSICDVLITVLDTITSSVNDKIISDKNFEFIIKPNPSDGIFKIESKTPVSNCMLEIYNINGVLLLKKNLHRGIAELNISNFTKGVYIVKVTGKEGMEYRDRVIIR